MILILCNPVVNVVLNSTKDCMYQYQTIQSTPDHEFSIQPNQTCWEYCRYFDNCTAFSFKLETSGVCRLYCRKDFDYTYSNYDRTETVYTGEKYCLKMVEAEKTFKNDTKTDEVYIQQLQTAACLGVSSTSRDRRDENLDWKPDCRNSTLWIIETLALTDLGKMVRIMNDESGKCVTMKTRYLCQSGMCPLAAMRMCSDEENQTFYMTSNPTTLGRSLRTVDDYRILTLTTLQDGRDDPKTMITRFILASRDFLSPCEKLAVIHGRVLVDTSQPLHVPGETIPVLCDPGYGVRTEAGYSQYITLVCSRDLVAPRCSKVPVLGDDERSGTIRIPSVVFYTVIVLVAPALVIFLICVTCIQRRRIQQLYQEDSTEEKEKAVEEEHPKVQ